MKRVLKTALDFGHFFSGKTKGEFASQVKPYLEAASKVAESFNLEDIFKLQ